MEYLEHEKLQKVKDKSQVIGEFLDWLTDEKAITFCKWQEDEEEIAEGTGYYPIYTDTNKLLAEFFEIDLDKLEKEKVDMLETFKKANNDNQKTI